MIQDKRLVGVRFDLATIGNLYAAGEAMTGQRIWIRVKKMRRNGTEYTQDVRTFISHNYCPFCGKKYATQ